MPHRPSEGRNHAAADEQRGDSADRVGDDHCGKQHDTLATRTRYDSNGRKQRYEHANRADGRAGSRADPGVREPGSNRPGGSVGSWSAGTDTLGPIMSE